MAATRPSRSMSGAINGEAVGPSMSRSTGMRSPMAIALRSALEYPSMRVAPAALPAPENSRRSSAAMSVAVPTVERGPPPSRFWSTTTARPRCSTASVSGWRDRGQEAANEQAEVLVELTLRLRRDGVEHERGLPGTRHAGEGRDLALGDAQRDVLEIVLARPPDSRCAPSSVRRLELGGQPAMTGVGLSMAMRPAGRAANHGHRRRATRVRMWDCIARHAAARGGTARDAGDAGPAAQSGRRRAGNAGPAPCGGA